MKLFLKLGFLCFFWILSSQITVSAQTSPDSSQQKVLVVLNNGTERIGYLLSDDGREILLETLQLGKIYIPKATIKSITPIVDGKPSEPPAEENLRPESPFSTRYYFTTNALPIKKGDHYVLTHLYGPEVHFAVGKRLSIGVMTTWLASPLALALKYTIPTKNENLNFGLGSIIGTSSFINTFQSSGGLHWGMATLGNRSKNITFSLGYNHILNAETIANQEIPGIYKPNQPIPTNQSSFRSKYKSAVLGLGGIYEIGKTASVILDCMLFMGQPNGRTDRKTPRLPNSPIEVVEVKTTFLYIMPGMRFQTSPNRAFQVALAGVSVFNNTGESSSFPLPMCSWFVKF